MKKYLSFFEHQQPNPSVTGIWTNLFLNLVASLIPFVFIAPVAATLTCGFLIMVSFALHFVKFRIYGPLTYLIAGAFILSLRSTLPHGSFSGEFFATAFAVLALMKSFNLKYYGDGIIFLILTLAVNSAIFLLDEDSSVLVILWTFATTLWTLGNLLRINLKNFSSPALLASLKSAAYAMLYTLPLLLFLFYIFQRFSHSPFYSDRSETMMGLSRTLEPGKISKLTESSNIALRVKLSEQEFPLALLYWRGTALTKSMGMRWGIAKDLDRVESFPHLGPKKDRCIIDQTVYLQKTNALAPQFALDQPIPETYSGTVPYKISSQICVQKKNVEDVTAAQLSGYLKVQTNVSEKTMELVRKFKRNSHSENEFVLEIYKYFRKEKFRYSLQPTGLTSTDPLEEFLFKTKNGFCEHYAAAVATLARLGGIPSRIITGFQGGLYNSFGDYWMVSYKDAHAWTEIWVKDKGWLRYDPVGVIAPERLQKGVQGLPGWKQHFLDHFNLERVGMLIDAFFFWMRDLFDNRETLISLDDLTFNPFHVGALIFVFSCWILIRWLGRDYSVAVYKQFRKLSILLNERTIARGRSEGFDDYRLRLLAWLKVRSHLRPLAPSIDRVFQKYIQMKYSAKKLSHDEIMELYEEIKTLKRAFRLKTNFLLELLRVKMPPAR